MAEESTKPPKVFISYAWEDDIKPWVREFATRLRSNGVDIILDQWAVVYGDQLPEFMENSVKASDYVLVICTPAYKDKSDSSNPSGVGYEKGVITGELFVKRNQRKFIPVLRKGKWLESAPSWVLGKNYIDLRGKPYSEENYYELLKTLYGKREPPPPLGTPPDFSGEGGSTKPVVPRKPLISKDDVDKFASSVRNVTRKLIPLLRVVGILITVGALLWVSSWAIPKIASLVPTPKATSTQPYAAKITFTNSPVVPIKTIKPTSTSVKTPTPAPTVVQTEITDTKGVQMVLVPAGNFISGDPSTSSSKTIYLDSFYIDKYEVTNGQYTSCVSAGACPPPLQKNSNHRSHYYDDPTYTDFPVLYVWRWTALSFCSWRGSYLPTAAQFEKAARGGDGLPYPWGEEISCSDLNYSDCTRDTTKVGTYESGKSPFGAYDMSGNVWEWVWDIYDSSLPSFVLNFSMNLLPTANKNVPILMGGAWDSNAAEVRSYFHTEDPYVNGGNAFALYNIGFRCARSVP